MALAVLSNLNFAIGQERGRLSRDGQGSLTTGRIAENDFAAAALLALIDQQRLSVTGG